MNKLIFFFLIFITLFANENDDFKNYKQKEKQQLIKQNGEFNDYLKNSETKFKTWQKNNIILYKKFESEIISQWGEFIEPTNKRWVEYSYDKKTVSSVNFENGVVRIEALGTLNDSEEDIKKLTSEAIKRLVTSKVSTNMIPLESEKGLMNEPLLAKQIITNDGQVVNESNVLKFVESIKENIEIVKVNNKQKAVVEFELVSDHLKKRMKPFLPIIEKYCQKYSLSKSRVLATIETESSFNPAAFSSAGAIGLMQLMPQYGGKEAYNYLYQNNDEPSHSYLYVPENNIHLGCIYIYLLKSKHFKGIEDSKSLQYCSIAAYNTGPKNTAKAFNANKNIKQAVTVINSRNNSQWVFSTLLEKLPYRETKVYLKQVTTKMSKYE